MSVLPRLPEQRPYGFEPAHALVRLVQDCVTGDTQRTALLLRLSALPPTWRKPHHVRLARETVEPLAQADRARCFQLSGGNLAVVWRGDDRGAEGRCRAGISLLFQDAAPDPARTVALRFELPADAPAILQALADAEVPLRPPAEPAQTLPALDPNSLSTLESRLGPADLARFARRRDVCALGPDGIFKLRWERRFLSVPELGAELAPDRDLRGDPWLFRRLTRMLDQRLLALLAAPGELTQAGPFCIRLNVASILSPGFLRFDAALPGALRGKVLLGLALPDAVADPAAFSFACAFCNARGYQVVVGGVAAGLLDAVSPTSFGATYLRLRWSPELALRAAPLRFDPSCVILAGCDDGQRLLCGRHLGISLFEGRAAARGRAPPIPAAAGTGAHRSSMPASRNLALGGLASAA